MTWLADNMSRHSAGSANKLQLIGRLRSSQRWWLQTGGASRQAWRDACVCAWRFISLPGRQDAAPIKGPPVVLGPVCRYAHSEFSWNTAPVAPGDGGPGPAPFLSPPPRLCRPRIQTDTKRLATFRWCEKTGMIVCVWLLTASQESEVESSRPRRCDGRRSERRRLDGWSVRPSALTEHFSPVLWFRFSRRLIFKVAEWWCTVILPVAGAPPTLECTWQEGRVEKSAGNQTTCSQPQQIFMSIAELVFTLKATVVYFIYFFGGVFFHLF